MNSLLSEIKYLARKSGLRPQRQSGQNFLINQKVLTEIIASSDLSLDDRVLEIGAGFGTLTKELAQRVKKVWAVELEKRFIPSLKKMSFAFSAIEVIPNDIRKTNVGSLIGEKPYKIVANLPYNLTSYLLRKFLEQEPKPSLMVLLIQKEVAERITALPGSLSLLGVSVQFYAEPKIIQIVKSNDFWPEPAVDSAIVKIEKIKDERTVVSELKRKSGISERDFFQVVRAGFSAKRKQIHNNLASSFHTNSEKIKKILELVGIDSKLRPQALSVEDWKKLTAILKQEKVL
ncbi:MAG: ribosomal RNA small subunit methyltransferase A [Candidatus Kerfeldbacteria bacterium CG_4_10_14_0_8_um_filter_42_10]|uniref:Ribosomal RNA small subunit methyltransferase A n=1 Tax=Candidatus Kerfeldbacteria bacterium CG_4_10_14_0_8_um_filter_42_10 TaxID=2014248 RepID=A0A2M7RKQ9_9BACT|nr:MAG: ribosomal RNA small subunit methyltransferase A [Candidatus Kerfeldbacteria bacterium CG_4_10_14_0_8_um_filter_42_10]